MVVLVAVVTTNSFVAAELDYKQYGVIPTDIYQLNPTNDGKSGYYVVKIEDKPSFVYCDMELECGVEKGWVTVADVNVTDGDECPHGWSRISSPAVACRAPSDDGGCYSAQFSTYSTV